MTDLLNSIFKRIGSEVPEVEFIDIDLEQLQLPSPPVSFPCALVDIAEENYSSNAQGQQIGQTVVNVTLGFRVYGPSDTKSAQEDRDRSMEHYEIVRKVGDALHGLSGPGFSPLSRGKLSRRASTYPRHFTLSLRTQRVVETRPRVPSTRKVFGSPPTEQAETKKPTD